MPSGRKARKSDRDGKLVGILDIGHDIGRLPQRIGPDRLQTDGPVSLAAARHADDVELNAAAQRMPLQRVGDAGPDLIEGCRSFCKERLEIHVGSPSTAVLWRSRRWSAVDGLDTIVGAGLVNGALRQG